MMLPPGSHIGILGGGQLGRMLSVAASRLGYHVHIFCPEKDCPAAEVSAHHTCADYTDQPALKKFAQSVEVVTFEFENIPAEAVSHIVDAPVYPSVEVLTTCQHRVLEKDFVSSLGIGTAEFQAVDSVDALRAAVKSIGAPGIVKTARFGYDGKGQAKIMQESDIASAWESLLTTEAVYEGFVQFEREISVIVARNVEGDIACYPAVENIHRHHILHQTIAPARIAKQQAEEAEMIARKIADSISLVGTLAVEMFIAVDGRVLVNELAPRPHNSGHWTMDACAVSQFEQTVRAVCGLPLGPTEPLCPAVMTNLIGNDVNDWQRWLETPHACLHLYGKNEAREGRKMGHVTVLDKTP